MTFTEIENAQQSLVRSDDADEDARLRRELSEAQEQLRARREELAAIEAEWSEFRARYMRTVGARYAELEEVERLISELQLTNAVEEESEAEKLEDESEAELKTQDDGTFQPLRQMRKLFWRVAKMFHPDLADDEVDRQRRHTLMTEATQAYAEGDAERLTSLLEDEEQNIEPLSSPERERRTGERTEIAQLRRESRRIEDEIKRITGADFFYLKTKTDEAARSGRDLLSEMAARVIEQTINARRRLEELQ
jgi:hypothetical protein